MQRLLLNAAVLLFAPVAASSQNLATDPLAQAESVGRWLVLQAQNDGAGAYWPVNALAPETSGDDLADGSAGVVVFLAGLARLSDDPDFRRLAVSGAARLSARIDLPERAADELRRASLYRGIAGTGVALMAVDQLDAANSYRDAIVDIVELLEEWTAPPTYGLQWSERFLDLLYGDTGTVLFLSFADDRYGLPRARDLANRGAHGIMVNAIQADQARTVSHWPFRHDQAFNLPNLTHGTAGTVYMLATLALQTGDHAYAGAAMSGFDYLRSIAEVDDLTLAIPYGWPLENWRDVRAFGWGHGIAGTALAFERLRQAGVRSTHARDFRRLAQRSLAHSGLPGDLNPPFTEASTPVDFRFGRAGVLSVASRLPESDTTAGLQSDIFDYLLETATRDENTLHWVVDVPEFMGGGRAAFTGLLHGAAGIGLSLLHYHEQRAGLPPSVLMPDDPRWAPKTFQ